MRPVISISEATDRLLEIFPRHTFDTVMSSPLAGAAAAALIYVDAIYAADDTFWARPSMVTWMSENILAQAEDSQRLAWRDTAKRNRKAVVGLLDSWSVPSEPGYADNSRETLRDETFQKWKDFSAIREKSDVSKNSSKGRWALEPHFADLFDPGIAPDDFADAAARWREAHLGPVALMKVHAAARREASDAEVVVSLPDRTTRKLEPGGASLILQAVIEKWAPARLGSPQVLTISEPGDKIHYADDHVLQKIGLRINATSLLPDAIIVDFDTEMFWFIEAVNTDGEINETRRQSLLRWAGQHGIRAEQCAFLTAFHSRNDAAAKKRLKDLALGTYAYFAAEPASELAWYRLPGD